MPVPGGAIAHAEIEKIELGIVYDRIPDCSAAANFPPLACPRLRCFREEWTLEWFRGIAGNGVETPDEIAGFGVISGDVSANTHLGAPISDDDFAFYDARRAGDCVAKFGVDRQSFPDSLTRGCV